MADIREVKILKLLEKNLKKGFVKVIPETFDDLWHLYNVIYKNDEIYARTSREIKQDERGYARPKRGERVSVFLGVKVENITWDKLLGRLRVHGTIFQAPDIVPTGAHHTINIALNTPVTIVKKEWAKHQLERLERASRTSEKPIIIVSIDDEGYAIATTAQYGVEVKAEENIKLPGKHEAEKREAAAKEFFKRALNGLRQVWMEKRCPIAIIGVGFVKNHFVKFLQNEAPEIADSIVDVKSVNNGGLAGIYEALRSGILLKAMKKQRIVEETELVEEILKRLGKSEKTVTYGLEEVEKAVQLGAVERLVLADTTLRETSDKKRRFLEELMRDVEEKGGEITVISTEHEAGAKLIALGGIAALLRFPVRWDSTSK
ncbi:MAG TPA: mRNA surveillance protein pelota [Candidatus Bathyarchaeota archaeon]|nr:mRNA surveillance protein pelota [Candidatus Bathyarchaeota archaeon]